MLDLECDSLVCHALRQYRRDVNKQAAKGGGAPTCFLPDFSLNDCTTILEPGTVQNVKTAIFLASYVCGLREVILSPLPDQVITRILEIPAPSLVIRPRKTFCSYVNLTKTLPINILSKKLPLVLYQSGFLCHSKE